jgi:hypothetical protein
MSINSKQLDRLLKKGGPAADAIREAFGTEGKSTLHAHRNGAVPTLQWAEFYVLLTIECPEMPMFCREDWLSTTDKKRTEKRVAKALVRINERKKQS